MAVETTETKRRQPLSLRIPTEDLHAIDQRAQQAGLNRTAYLIAAALDKLPGTTHQARLQAIEERLDHVEAALYG